jgi:tetratricopeptide (TPR) repeat protein
MNLAMNVDSARTEDAVRLDQEANRQLDFFLEKAPGDSVLLTYMMHRAYQAGDIEKVSQLLQKVSDDSVDDHMVWVYRAWYHTMMGQLDDSENAIQEAIRLHPASPLAHHEYANLLRKRGQLILVEREQNLAALGRELRTRLLREANANSIEADILLDIAKYLRACGDEKGYESLELRLREFGYSAEAGAQP